MRSQEDWYEVMGNYLNQLKVQAHACGAPIILAGDVFDHPEQPPELINFLIENWPASNLGGVPTVLAIPGQHDLPYHRYADLKKSAFWTMVEAHCIYPLDPKVPTWMEDERMMLHAFPWEFPLKPTKKRTITLPSGKKRTILNVAVCHKYVWFRKKHPEATEDQYVESVIKELGDNYDLAVFGDNHQGFTAKVNQTTVINCGTFIRRTLHDVNYRPRIWMLTWAGEVVRWRFDLSKDRPYVKREEVTETRDDATLQSFVAELINTIEHDVDFSELVRRTLKQNPHLREEVVQLVLKAVEGRNERTSASRRG